MARKVSSIDCGTLSVTERNESDYSLFLSRDNNGAIEELGLYCVRYVKPYSATVHVLAINADSAIGQADCALGIESYRRPSTLDVEARATRLPMLIQGWGSQSF